MRQALKELKIHPTSRCRWLNAKLRGTTSDFGPLPRVGILGQVTIISNVNGDAFPAKVCTLNIRELLGPLPLYKIHSKSNPSKPSSISFWSLRTTKPLYQTKNAASFWTTFSEQNAASPSLKPAARLLVSPGAYKACWEWVDRCDRRGDFWELRNVPRIGGIIHHDLRFPPWPTFSTSFEFRDEILWAYLRDFCDGLELRKHSIFQSLNLLFQQAIFRFQLLVLLFFFQCVGTSGRTFGQDKSQENLFFSQHFFGGVFPENIWKRWTRVSFWTALTFW